MKLFELQKGDKFQFDPKDGIIFTVKRFFERKMFGIKGKVLHCDTVDNNGMHHWFTRNVEIIKMD